MPYVEMLYTKGGNDNSFSSISSHSLALQFLSNNLASTPNNSLITSPQLLHQFTGNGLYTSTSSTNPLLYAINSKSPNNPLSIQAHPEAPGSPIHVKQPELSPNSHTKESSMSHTKLMSSPSRHSPTMITSTEGGGGNLSHLTQPPYGLSLKHLNTFVTLNKIPPNIA